MSIIISIKSCLTLNCFDIFFSNVQYWVISWMIYCVLFSKSSPKRIGRKRMCKYKRTKYLNNKYLNNKYLNNKFYVVLIAPEKTDWLYM